MRFIVNETDPKELVIVDKRTHRQIGKFVNGVLDTENPKLILKLKSRFKTIEVEPVKEDLIDLKPIKDENNTLYHCNKCDFKAEKHSDLMNHYKKIHPKEKKNG